MLIPRIILGVLALLILGTTLPAYLDTSANPGLAALTGEAATLGSVAGLFLGRQLTIALIAVYGAVRGTREPMLIGAFGIVFFNLHDAFFLMMAGTSMVGAVAGLVLALAASVVIVLTWRKAP